MCSTVASMHVIVLFIIVFNIYIFQDQNIWSRVWELPGPVSLTPKIDLQGKNDPLALIL